MNNWNAPQRPNSYAEHMLVNEIIDGTFPARLPSCQANVTLAEQLGVTRPTLREAIQRLARDGLVDGTARQTNTSQSLLAGWWFECSQFLSETQRTFTTQFHF